MDFFSQAQVDALRRLKDAFEQKLLDEDEYKAEKAKVLNAAAAPAPPAPPPASDDADFELVGVQTPAERAAESRRRAEAEFAMAFIDGFRGSMRALDLLRLLERERERWRDKEERRGDGGDDESDELMAPRVARQLERRVRFSGQTIPAIAPVALSRAIGLAGRRDWKE